MDPAPFSLSIESGSGAVGDAVGVNLVIESRMAAESTAGFMMMVPVCHDPQVADMLGNPHYTDEFIALLGPTGVQQYKVIEGSAIPGNPIGYGFFLIIEWSAEGYRSRFPSDEPLVLATLYYRLKGNPGDDGALSICTGVLERAQTRCTYPFFIESIFLDPSFRTVEYLPESVSGGTLTVLEGPATHPNPPPQPPESIVYPGPLTQEEVNFQVRIGGAQAVPGATNVPVEVYLSADVEYAAVQVPLEFDGRYLRLSRAVDYFSSGLVLFGDRPGAYREVTDGSDAVIFSGWGANNLRLGAAGEEVHAATLYFDVLDAAKDVEATTIAVRTLASPSGGAKYQPWLGIRYESGEPEDPTVRAQIEPFRITEGQFNILGDVSYFTRGDTNRDGEVNIADPVAALDYLFLGGRRPVCLDAADANDDGLFDISDPIATLRFLFNGGGVLPAPSGVPGVDLTPDGLDC